MAPEEGGGRGVVLLPGLLAEGERFAPIQAEDFRECCIFLHPCGARDYDSKADLGLHIFFFAFPELCGTNIAEDGLVFCASIRGRATIGVHLIFLRLVA